MKVNKLLSLTDSFKNDCFARRALIFDIVLFVDTNKYSISCLVDTGCCFHAVIDTTVAHKMCDALKITFYQLSKLRPVAAYDEHQKKSIVKAVYLSMTFQNHTEHTLSMLLTNLEQHVIILSKL